jgi:hypothetical protein
VRARLLDLWAAILARLGFLRRPVAPAASSAPAPVPRLSPPAVRVTRYPTLLGSPGCNREGGAP